MLARVSQIETYRKWTLDEDQDLDDLIARLTTHEPTEKMLVGTAFHKALEEVGHGSHEILNANGYTFRFMGDSQLTIPSLREIRTQKKYGPLTVTGQADVIAGKRIEDHKTTSRFDPEKYMEGYQWRYYLDLFAANVFQWNVFVIRESGERIYTVEPVQTFQQYRYPGLHLDCLRLATDYFDVASQLRLKLDSCGVRR